MQRCRGRQQAQRLRPGRHGGPVAIDAQIGGSWPRSDATTPSLKRNVLPCVRSGASLSSSIVASERLRSSPISRSAGRLAGGNRRIGQEAADALARLGAGQHVDAALVDARQLREEHELGAAPRGDGTCWRRWLRCGCRRSASMLRNTSSAIWLSVRFSEDLGALLAVEEHAVVAHRRRSRCCGRAASRAVDSKLDDRSVDQRHEACRCRDRARRARARTRPPPSSGRCCQRPCASRHIVDAQPRLPELVDLL